MNAVWVGDDLVHNGVPMQIQHFTTNDTMDNVLSYYRTLWADPIAEGVPGFVENNMDNWAVISRINGDKNTVIQVRLNSDGQTEGYISIADLSVGTSVEELRRKFPMPVDSELVSNTESRDPHNSASTIIYINDLPIEENASFLVDRLSDKYKLARKFDQDGTLILFFNGKKSKIEVAISKEPGGRTTVFANVVKG